NVVREGRKEVVRRCSGAQGVFAGIRVHTGHLEAGRDRLHFSIGIAKRGKIAERDMLKPVAGGADFLVYLEAALELLAIELAERTSEREAHVPRVQVELVLSRRRDGLRRRRNGAQYKGPGQGYGKEQPD